MGDPSQVQTVPSAMRICEMFVWESGLLLLDFYALDGAYRLWKMFPPHSAGMVYKHLIHLSPTSNDGLNHIKRDLWGQTLTFIGTICVDLWRAECEQIIHLVYCVAEVILCDFSHQMTFLWCGAFTAWGWIFKGYYTVMFMEFGLVTIRHLSIVSNDDLH